MVRFLSLLAVCLVGSLLFTGCGNTRGPNSEFIPPPSDPQSLIISAGVQELLSNEALRMSRPREYFLGPGDVLGITLVGRPDILGVTGEGAERFSVTVTESPMITLPLIGALVVHGKTSAQLEEELRTAYAKFIANPIPVVTVEKYYFNKVTVLGAVQTPGSYPLDFGDTLVDAVFKANGLSFGGKGGGLPPARYLKVYREKLNNKERAQMTQEEILEAYKEGTKILPREEIVIPIEQFILNGDMEYNIPLFPNDLVYIPGAGTVIVHGRVAHPGVTFLGPSLRTLAQVITERGRLRYSAASIVEIVRTYPDGTQESFYEHVRRVQRRDDPDFLMQDGDQVFIFTHPARDVLEFIGNIFRAGVSTGYNATYGV
jgi:polysaccharide export outer membrane protein